MKAIDGHEVEFVRREQWIEGVDSEHYDRIIYRWRGRLWRCSAKEWARRAEWANTKDSKQ